MSRHDKNFQGIFVTSLPRSRYLSRHATTEERCVALHVKHNERKAYLCSVVNTTWGDRWNQASHYWCPDSYAKRNKTENQHEHSNGSLTPATLIEQSAVTTHEGNSKQGRYDGEDSEDSCLGIKRKRNEKYAMSKVKPWIIILFICLFVRSFVCLLVCLQ